MKVNSLLNNGYATETKGEEWKPIPGYECLYEASNLGRIRTAEGKVTSSAKFEHRVWKQRIMKPKHPTAEGKRKDLRVTLWKDGVPKDYLVSRLVAMAWYGVPEQKMTVNHINGDYLDNRIENLEWCTLAENIQKGLDTGLYDSMCHKVTLVCPNGETLNFRSKSQASRFLGRSEGYIGEMIRHGHPICGKDKTKYGVIVDEK